MLRIGICDDEQAARFSLHCRVERCLEQANVPCTLYEFSSAEGVLSWLAKHPSELDLLFLDIEMQGANGMEAAQKIRENDTTLSLVFVTGYADYVFDGYTVGAMDYLTKPPNTARLAQVLNRVQAVVHKQDPETFTIQNTEGLFRIPHNHILYFMSDRRQVILVTKKSRIPFYAKLDEIEQQLDDGFVRLHRRYLVRVQAIDCMVGDIVTIGAENLPVSRNQKQSVIQAIAETVVKRGN